ncbi:MAG: cold shock domain-containing protein [Methylococcales bacterium]|nr:cold shock domain-containing protein [Methylococcales bacterium]
MKGKVDQWKDEKGFGFIAPDDEGEKVFFHISAVKTQVRRPQAGDIVIYETSRDSQNKLKAKTVIIESVVAQSTVQKKTKANKVESPQKNMFDYVLIFVLLASLGGMTLAFFQSQRLEDAIFRGIPALIAIVLLNRQKKPKDKNFSCSRCKKITEHDARTIEAWNNGFSKFYCRPCHHQWLIDNPVQKQSSTSNGGCLGVFLFLILAPIAIVTVSLYQWVS